MRDLHLPQSTNPQIPHHPQATAIALRSRWRRSQLAEDIRAEVAPTNMLFKGPTGSGKTEIARRLSTLADAPFIKVEATRYTETG